MTSAMEAQDEMAKIREAYRVLFSSPQGKEVLGHMMETCFWKTSTFHADPQIFAFNEGTRSVVLNIFDMMEPVHYEALDQHEPEEDYENG